MKHIFIILCLICFLHVTISSSVTVTATFYNFFDGELMFNNCKVYGSHILPVTRKLKTNEAQSFQFNSPKDDIRVDGNCLYSVYFNDTQISQTTIVFHLDAYWNVEWYGITNDAPEYYDVYVTFQSPGNAQYIMKNKNQV
jgi:hypothetical protein